MGKAQSKRSVDITTDVKKDDAVEEGTGKVEKIDDVDQVKPQLNGDTHANETETNDKIGEIESTEEKDLSTEKDQQKQVLPEQKIVDTETGGDSVQCNENEDTTATAEDVNNETSTTEANESSKKKKKDKSKKWSFRNISFGKKDKQKPAKKDEVTVNGECDKVPEEANEEATLTTTNGEAKADENGVEVCVEEKNGAEEVMTKVNAVDNTEIPLLNGQAENASVELKNEMISVEEKKTEFIKEKIEEKQKATPPVIETTAEILKEKLLEQTNGIKPEVIDENISDANNIKVDENIQIECEVEKERIDNSEISDTDNVHSVVPPPLPFNPPPSPVMVFALSDTKLNESEQDNTQIEALVNVGNRISTNIKTDTLGLVSVAEEEDVTLPLEGQKIEIPIITHSIHEEEIGQCDQNEINVTENESVIDTKFDTDTTTTTLQKEEEEQSEINNLTMKDIENMITPDIDNIIKLAEEKITTNQITDISNLINDVANEAVNIVHDKIETTAADLSAEVLIKADQIIESFNNQNHLFETEKNDIILESNSDELKEKVAVNVNGIFTNIDKLIALDINGDQSIICNNSIDGDMIGDNTSITESKNGFSDNHETSPTEIEALNGQAENNGTIIDAPSKLNPELGQETLVNAVPVAQ